MRDSAYLYVSCHDFLVVGIQNVKSREDLVMLENGSTADPFGAAPFNAKSKSRKRDQKLAGLYISDGPFNLRILTKSPH